MTQSTYYHLASGVSNRQVTERPALFPVLLDED